MTSELPPPSVQQLKQPENLDEAKAQIEMLQLQLSEKTEELSLCLANQKGKPFRRRLPDTRPSVTHKFDISGHKGYVTVGLFEDGGPGEMFITMAKEGSTLGGMMDSFGAVVSIALQFGVPLDMLIKKFAYTQFEPSGWTGSTIPGLENAKSIMDYIFRWMDHQFTALEGADTTPIEALMGSKVSYFLNHQNTKSQAVVTLGDACPECGSTKIRRTGTCATCENCGTSLGCG